jgi:hypothetical protein
MTIREAKVSLRNYLGQHSIHSLGTRNNKIYIYHSKDICHAVKEQIERAVSPFKVKWEKDSPGILC